MQKFFFFILLLCGCYLQAQEIGHVKKGKHLLKLVKTDPYFELVYSDMSSKEVYTEKSFKFLDKEKVFRIIMDGFLYKKDHQVVVWSDQKDTVVKFNFKKIKGEVLVYLNHNNLEKKVIGLSSFFNKDQIAELFGNP